MRRTVIIIASVVVSAAFLALVLRDVPFSEVVDSAREADVFWLAMTFLFATIGLWTRAIRWRGLLDWRIGQRDAFLILGVTFLLNQLPLRVGEVARGLLATQRGVPFVTAATSIVVERMLDTLLVVVALLLAISQLPDVPPSVSGATGLFGVLGVIAFVVLVGFARYPDLARRLVRLLGDLLPPLRRLPLEKLLDQLLDGLRPLTDPRRLAHAVIWSLISWAFSFSGMIAMLYALDILDVPLLLTSVLGVTLASFSVAIPVSVAAVGPFEAAIRVTGELVGMVDVEAVALGFIVHGMTVLAYIVWGVAGIVVLGVSVGDMLRRAEQPDPQPEAKQ